MKQNNEVKKMPTYFCETDYGLKGYYNTESKVCTNKKYQTCEEKAYLRLKNP